MKKTKYLLIILGILLITGSIFIIAQSNQDCEKKVDFYYNPSCPHCQEVAPLIEQLKTEYSDWKFSYYDVSQTSYTGISGVPTIKLYPDGKNGREILLEGSYEIPKYLKCELEEKSTPECPTHINLIRGSYFLE